MTQKTQNNPLGRLSVFGLTHPFQAAFLLPKQWEDMRETVTLFDRHNLSSSDGPKVIEGFLTGEPKFKRGKAPKIIGSLRDNNSRFVNFSKFGDTKDFQKMLSEFLKGGQKVTLFGDIEYFEGRPWLKDPQIVPDFWKGKMRPVYPGKTKVIKPETVRDRVLEILFKKENICNAVQFLAETLKEYGPPEKLAELAGCPGWTLRQIIGLAHLPKNEQIANQAVEGLERLAGMGILLQARHNTTAPVPGYQLDKELARQSWVKRMGTLPFQPTIEQMQASRDIVADQFGVVAGKRFLSGDVGTGKTVVYALPAAVAADQGATVGILLPNEILAKEIGASLQAYWPDIPMQTVTGKTKKMDEKAQIYIGTTALLFRAEDKKFDFVIVDEQQKFSRDQRESLVQKGTHLLEVSATCIPRSQALVKFGFVKLSKLTKCHVDKHIDTKIRTMEDKSAMFTDIKKTIADGGQVLVIYPKKVDDPEKDSDLPAVEDALPAWERFFPGQVEMAHSDSKDNDAVMQRMKNGQTTILLSTTVVEVGVNIPNLKRVSIMNADRYGLSVLHQIRGRAARTGGLGHCDLFLPVPRAQVKDKVLDRLSILEQTNDGFKIAEHDLMLRGAGNLSKDSDKQSGADESFLFGKPVRIEVLEDIIKDLPVNLRETIPGPASDESMKMRA